MVTLLGANGAGKTTTLQTVSGLLRPRGGRDPLRRQRVDGLRPHEIVGLGIWHSPEGRRVFPLMSVRENLEMGAYRFRRVRPEDLDQVFDLFPVLAQRSGQYAGTLSGGEQQMLAIGRALMGQPRLLLLDEPSMGLAPLIVAQIFEIIRQINAQGDDGAARGAERRAGPRARRPRLRAGDRQRRAERLGAANCWADTAGAGRLPRGGRGLIRAVSVLAL